ncbi:ECF transporter S component [Ligilactobacillus acidipiscis]|jgi:Protein of unknown function (DUF1393).|uniref:ECF transporter S component n=1 Tax=Ligilactobacillus acidipiscis TaxID=89059 RepID=UPI002FD9F786
MRQAHNSIRKITMLGLLAAICTVLRIIKVPLPNVQPVTDIIMIVTLINGSGAGLVLAILTMLVSNLYLGFGIWTVPQITAYIVCVLTVLLFKKLFFLQKFWWLQLGVATLLGLEYGLIVSLCMVVIGQTPAFIAYYTSGFLFDIYHAAGNLVFYPLIYWPLSKVLQNYAQE